MNAMPVPEIDLSSSMSWPKASERHGIGIAAGTEVAPMNQLLAHISHVYQGPERRDIDTALERAAKALASLPPELQLGAPGTKDAVSALSDLVEALENSQLEENSLPAAQALINAYREPKQLPLVILEKCVNFAAQVALKSRTAVATFSLIMFRSSDHAGKIKTSWDNDRASWMRALKPREEDSEDQHLAIVLPSDAIPAVENLASRLEVLNQLPCVLFLGSDLPVSDGSPLFLSQNIAFSNYSSPPMASWTCYKFHPEPPTYSDQLRAIYATVYGKGALLPGERITAAADLVKLDLLKRLNPVVLLKLVAGALVGPGTVAAIEVGEKLFSRSK
jgi:hypothetical protein